MYDIKSISPQTQKEFYQRFKEEKTFLQQSQYGDFRSKTGEKILRYGIYKQNQLTGAFQIQKITSCFKSYLHIPHGPLIDKAVSTNQNFWDYLLPWYITLGKKEKVDLIRISPLISPNTKINFKTHGFKDAPVHLINPEKTWVLDIQKPIEDLLANMKKSTRYEIKKGNKGCLKIQIGNSHKDLDIFWNLHQATVQRQGFTPFPIKQTELQLKCFGDNIQIISVSDNDSNWLSSSIIIFDDQSAYYHQGASVYSKLPASHQSLYQAILEAQKRGCISFNFWGVCDENATKHPWYGLSKFKRGFGGYEQNYLHVQDYTLTIKGYLNQYIELYRKWKKNY